MSDTIKVLTGVQKAIARTGAQAVLKRKTAQKDPNNPTNVITVTATYTVDGLLYPKTTYEPSVGTTITRTMFIPDLLSVRDSGGARVNTLTAINFYTKLGDTITQDGKTYKLLENEQPMLKGKVVACLHQATVL